MQKGINKIFLSMAANALLQLTPTTISVQHVHWRLRLPVRCMYYPRREANRLLLAKGWQSLSRIRLQWQKKSIPSSLLSKNFEVCSLVWIFMILPTIETWRWILLSKSVLCWHTKIEEFSPMLHYIEGPLNILANNLSRIHHLIILAQIAEGKKLVEPAEVSNKEENKVYFLDKENSGLNDNEVWECI